MSLCAKAFSFYTLNDDSHPSPSDNCIKTSCKHAKPSSLKYADTTNRKTDLKYIYIYIFIYSIGKCGGGEASRNGVMVEVGVDYKIFSSGERAREKTQSSEQREEK
jgi:hypothetical protein